MLGDITVTEKIYIAVGYTDMCKSIDGLTAIVHEQFLKDPYESAVFVVDISSKDNYNNLVDRNTKITFGIVWIARKKEKLIMKFTEEIMTFNIREATKMDYMLLGIDIPAEGLGRVVEQDGLKSINLERIDYFQEENARDCIFTERDFYDDCPEELENNKLSRNPAENEIYIKICMGNNETFITVDDFAKLGELIDWA